MDHSSDTEQTLEERKAELDRREAALIIREDSLSQRMEAAEGILDAADQRDAIADARDTGADTRDRDVDRAEFLTNGNAKTADYGTHLPQRRDAALDREHAKGNRAASQDDRIALTGDLHPTDGR